MKAIQVLVLAILAALVVAVAEGVPVKRSLARRDGMPDDGNMGMPGDDMGMPGDDMGMPSYDMGMPGMPGDGMDMPDYGDMPTNPMPYGTDGSTPATATLKARMDGKDWCGQWAQKRKDWCWKMCDDKSWCQKQWDWDWQECQKM